jgi:hypothetical protein
MKRSIQAQLHVRDHRAGTPKAKNLVRNLSQLDKEKLRDMLRQKGLSDSSSEPVSILVQSPQLVEEGNMTTDAIITTPRPRSSTPEYESVSPEDTNSSTPQQISATNINLYTSDHKSMTIRGRRAVHIADGIEFEKPALIEALIFDCDLDTEDITHIEEAVKLKRRERKSRRKAQKVSNEAPNHTHALNVNPHSLIRRSP